MKYCSECKYLKIKWISHRARPFYCTHPEFVVIDKVTKEIHYPEADSLRASRGRCGPVGSSFEPKLSLLEKIKGWMKRRAK